VAFVVPGIGCTTQRWPACAPRRRPWCCSPAGGDIGGDMGAPRRARSADSYGRSLGHACSIRARSAAVNEAFALSGPQHPSRLRQRSSRRVSLCAAPSARRGSHASGPHPPAAPDGDRRGGSLRRRAARSSLQAAVVSTRGAGRSTTAPAGPRRHVDQPHTPSSSSGQRFAGIGAKPLRRAHRRRRGRARPPPTPAVPVTPSSRSRSSRLGSPAGKVPRRRDHRSSRRDHRSCDGSADPDRRGPPPPCPTLLSRHRHHHHRLHDAHALPGLSRAPTSARRTWARSAAPHLARVQGRPPDRKGHQSTATALFCEQARHRDASRGIGRLAVFN
jgi:hypothetical protein